MKNIIIILGFVLIGSLLNDLSARRIKIGVDLALGLPIWPITCGYGQGFTDCADIPSLCLHFQKMDNYGTGNSGELEVSLNDKTVELFLDNSGNYSQFIVGNKFVLQNRFYLSSDLILLSTEQEINNIFVPSGEYDYRIEENKLIVKMPIETFNSYDDFFVGGYEHLKKNN